MATHRGLGGWKWGLCCGCDTVKGFPGVLSGIVWMVLVPLEVAGESRVLND